MTTETEPRVYLVYADVDGGQSKHVIAKNRKEAGKLAGFPYTHVAWRPWVKFEGGQFIDKHTGRIMTPSKLSEILKIVNEPGMTWKVRQALLRENGLSEAEIEALVPPPPDGLPWHPGDY